MVQVENIKKQSTKPILLYAYKWLINIIENNAIKQASIIDNIDMNYCKDINKVIPK